MCTVKPFCSFQNDVKKNFAVIMGPHYKWLHFQGIHHTISFSLPPIMLLVWGKEPILEGLFYPGKQTEGNKKLFPLLNGRNLSVHPDT